jgi:hypothetical protein
MSPLNTEAAHQLETKDHYGGDDRYGLSRRKRQLRFILRTELSCPRSPPERHLFLLTIMLLRYSCQFCLLAFASQYRISVLSRTLCAECLISGLGDFA